MIKNSSNLLFINTLMLSTIMVISSNSWIGCWMGLEINLLSFIPLMVNKNNLLSTEATIKYFLMQAFTSSLLLFSIILFMISYNFTFELTYFKNLSFSTMIFFTLLIKSGTAPFHFWFPIVIEGLSWINSFILMTWQKIAPLLMISYFSFMNSFSFFIIISTIIGSLGGLNQISLRKIMAFSSINHIGWMLTAMMFNEYLWIFYFIIYSITSLTIVLIFNMNKIFYFNQLFSMNMKSQILKFTFFISLLSLGGLPPFLGFFPKWMVIQSMIEMNQLFIMMILICTSLLTLYFYLRICYSTFMFNIMQPNWLMNYYFNYKMMFLLIMFLMISLAGLIQFLSLTYIFY
uniref:NADH-ubiquinone oxidoreductase chain 2 n=1 Tax=Acnemia nitidicollis TaxID=2339098 RepID=A0A7D7FCW1_9DIPT|nr:NADH dehydrogenase subunit 2 [Acnemia nitidicollis]QMP96645.1 NADH dehydrogenase subunit 2 [Acnemia nitidicollis]